MRNLLSFTLLLFASANLRADSPPFPTKTLRLSTGVTDFIWDATRSRFLAAGATSVLTIDPDAAALESTLAIGETADRISISGDGQLLYVAVNARGAIKRYRMRDGGLDLEISLGRAA